MNHNLIKTILENYETPTYVFDINKLKNRISYLRKMLPSRVKLCYAIKANTFIVKDIEDVVDRFEVCSPGEYQICKESGVNDKKVIISGVYKTPKFIENLIQSESEIERYTIESLEQFELLKKTNKNINVLIRITSGNQFGINDYEAEEIIAHQNEYENMKIRGIQYFSGTQKKSIKNLNRELTFLQEFIKNMENKYNYKTEELEYGSGFPISYFKNEEFDEEEFLKQFSELINNLEYDGKIVLELGRSIVADCGIYITKVVDQKINKGQNYAILDGGMNHIVYYGQSMAMKVPKCEVFPLKEGEEKNWNLCGSLCTINDILVKQYPVRNLEIGDAFIFKNTGAYCMTEGISLFLSRDLPSVLKIMENNEIEIIRENIPTYKFNM